MADAVASFVELRVRGSWQFVGDFKGAADAADKELGRLEGSGKKGSRALTELGRSSTTAREGLQNIATSLAIIQGPLGPVAGRFTALSAAVGRIGPVDAGTTATLAGVTAGTVAAISAAAD